MEVSAASERSGDAEAADAVELDASAAPLSPIILRDEEGTVSTCAICLGEIESAAMVSACFHSFCYVCIAQWSEVNPTCPLCKAPMGSLIHDIVSDVEFSETPVPAVASATGEQQRSRAQRSSAWGARQAASGGAALQRRRRVYLRRLVPLPISGSRLSQRRQQRHSSVAGGGGSEVSFATSSPLLCTEAEWERRGRAWAERDLQCLLEGEDVKVLVLILGVLLNRAGGDLRSEWLKEEWAKYLGSQAELFMRELGCFLSTPFDMQTYDRLVRYADVFAV